VSKIAPNLARFCPQNLLGGRPQSFGAVFINWTCFRTCGKISRRSVHEPQIFRDEKKFRKTVVKHKAFRELPFRAV